MHDNDVKIPTGEGQLLFLDNQNEEQETEL